VGEGGGGVKFPLIPESCKTEGLKYLEEGEHVVTGNGEDYLGETEKKGRREKESNFGGKKREKTTGGERSTQHILPQPRRKKDLPKSTDYKKENRCLKRKPDHTQPLFQRTNQKTRLTL